MNIMRPRISALMPLLILLAASGIVGCGDELEQNEFQTYTVRQGDLRIFIRQKGEILARDPVAVNNPIAGRSTLLEIVPEGSFVKKGDRLFELDVNEAQDRLLQQKIQSSSAEQNLFAAQQQLEIQKQQNESDVKRAELEVLFAELDMKQYLEGDLPSEREERDSDIKLAEEELKRAIDTLNWSKELAKRGYISEDKLESDELSVKRWQIQVRLNKRKLEVLQEFTSKKRIEELRSNLAEAKRELIRVNAKVAAALAQKVKDVENREAQNELEKVQLERLEHQVKNNVVYAPCDGLVVYAREGGGRRDSKPLEPGDSLREGQTVCTIPDMSKVRVDVDVHESWIQKVQLGMPVIVTTDTGEMLQGEIEYIASVPDSQSWYRNPDLKVYSTNVTIENPGGRLRPGMNCSAEIVLNQLRDVVQVPIQSVHSNGRKHFVYVKSGEVAELREVEVGEHNGEMIHVATGVRVGEEVYLAAPPDAPGIPLADAEERPEIIASTRGGEAGSGPEGMGSGGAGDVEGRDGRGGRPGGARPGGAAPDMEAIRERMKNMTPEEREKAVQRMREARGGGGRPDGARQRNGQGG